MDLLNTLFQSAPWGPLRIGLHVVFLLAAVYVLKQALDLRAVTALKHLAKPRAGFGIAAVLVLVGFGAVLVHQATWQLFGTTRPAFVAFMQLHDRRQFNPAHWIQRGRILGAAGTVLAETRAVQTSQGVAAQRYYPFGPDFAHVVGYADPRFGASGIEAAANVQLNGGNPDSWQDWGEIGRQVLTQAKRPKGSDVTLTLDAALQRLAMERLGDRAGAVVVLRPQDGAVRVLASSPSFDPNHIDADMFLRADPRARLLNRATAGLYPPGSTFKVVVAAEALDRGFSGRIDCPADGWTTSGRYRKIRDHEYYEARRAGRTWRGHGRIGLDTGLIESSNVFFAQLGVYLGHDAFRATTKRFLFNGRISIGAGHSRQQFMRTGRIPRIATSDRYGLAQASIGQGKVLATPAQMALIAAAVANDGVAVRPRLIAGEAPAVVGRFMRPDTARRLRRILRRVVVEGTGRGIDTPGLAIAGKTGTAENPFGATHSWFIGFAPADRPALAFAVLVEHGGYGSTAAAPIARDLMVLAKQRGHLP
ncbi:MAG: penicillin-binding protein 2 [Thiohalocapsa sp.]|uniref:peptidoglycan D,D-transpeptidase FtsI family protein n=1 Tax=Thiohalocapsa sp. TaxID=2497641 RepID=UPI0025E753D8|nr:penicillin-binding transpeptidase domain-containing protein [Thiohalocapsa sp.]MCG6943459.1 penicillin-binding protein 2 [Thiohalocapsa sp.]